MFKTKADPYYTNQQSELPLYLPAITNAFYLPYVEEAHILEQLNFIRKVYLLLSLQIFYTIGLVSLCYFVKPIFDFLMANPYIFFIAMGVYISLVLMMTCFGEVSRASPWNYILLFILTTSVGIFLGAIVPFHDGRFVFIALGITLFVTMMASMFACQTNYDFTAKGGILFSLVIGLIALIVLQFFMRDNIFGLIISVFGAFLMTAFIIYDTQLIMGGKHRKYQLRTDEHVFGALLLFTDILNLFLFILGFGRN